MTLNEKPALECNYNQTERVYEMIMRRFILLFIFTFLFLASYGQEVEKVYLFDDFRITETDGYYLINFENTLLYGLPGEPALPYRQIALLLKPGQVADSMELIFENEWLIPGQYELYPAQYSVPLLFEGKQTFIKNKQLYSSTEDHPGDPKGHLTTAFMDGYSVAMSSFTPVRYNPFNKKISYFGKVIVKLFTSAGSQQLAVGNRQDDVIRLVQNPEDISQYSLINNNSKNNSYQLLIITSPAFENRFQPLMDLYLTRGMKSQVVSTTYINMVMPGQDLQEKIRNYIIQEYQNNNIRYVLLGGDEEVVPSRKFFCEVQSITLVVSYDIPADIYYSALDGNWNTDNDTLWGEPGEEDLLPEVAVGRLVISDTNDLNNAFNKIISYQNNPVQGELRDPLLAGEHLYSNPLTWGGDYLDLLIGYHTDNGYTTDGIPADQNIEKLYDREVGTWLKDTLIARINRGKSFVHHAGHANTYYDMRMNMSDITNANFNQLDGTTHNFTLVYSHGCYSGAFDLGDCIAEKMLNIERFALVYVGNSRYGWFNEGQTEGPSTHLHREFTSALYSKKINRLGAAHMESKTVTAPWVTLPGQWEEGALRYCFYSCNVLGDPVMAVWTDENIIVNATYQDTIHALVPLLQVLVDTGGNPVEGFTCTIMKNGNFHGTAVTDSLGYAYINLDPPVIDTGKAQLIVSGYNCLPVTFPVYFINPCQVPFIDFGPDTIINPGVTLNLDAGPGYFSYLWSDGSTGQTLSVNTSGTYWVEVVTTEGCSNSDTISVYSGYIISGILTYKDTMMVSTPLSGVDIMLKDQNNTIIGFTVTDASGYYEFTDLYSGIYFLEEQITKSWGGVNTLDALKVVLHFIGINSLGGLNKIAGDVSAEGVINTMDALNIQMRFVGMISSFPSGDWVFEKDTLVVGGNSHCMHNYHALCFGDVDGSYIPAVKGGQAVLNSTPLNNNQSKTETIEPELYFNTISTRSK